MRLCVMLTLTVWIVMVLFLICKARGLRGFSTRFGLNKIVTYKTSIIVVTSWIYLELGYKFALLNVLVRISLLKWLLFSFSSRGTITR